jgi:hypothetical protein
VTADAPVIDPVKCRSCRAAIFWAITEAKGKLQPIDAKPVDAGNLVVERRGSVYYAHVVDLFDKPGPRFMPHHATCPDVEDWKR